MIVSKSREIDDTIQGSTSAEIVASMKQTRDATVMSSDDEWSLASTISEMDEVAQS